MPVRFRCAYCNQLMGISKRKVGKVVTCPKCGGQVVVPAPDPAQEALDLAEGNAAAAFEEDDEVQKLLEYVEETKPAPAAAVAPAPARRAPVPAPQLQPAPRPIPQPVVGSTGPANDYDVVPMNDASMPPLVPARGIYLTTGVLTIVLVLIGLLVGMSFFLGFLIGRSTMA